MDIKSFLIFLSRNKAYTLINVLGLSVSLTFVILIGVYSYQERSVDRQLDKGDRLEVVCTYGIANGDKCEGIHHIVGKYLKQQFPQIEATCGVCKYDVLVNKGGEKVKARMFCADSNFFQLFNYKLLEGDRRTCLQGEDGAVVTESFARRMFGSADPVGKKIVWQDTQKMRITGIVQDMDNTLFNSPDFFVKFCFRNVGACNGSNTDEYAEKNIGLNLLGSSLFLLMHRGATLQDKSKEMTDCIHSHWDFFNDKSWRVNAFTTKAAGLYLSGIENANDVTTRGNAKLLNILLLAALVILFFAITNYINLTVAQSGYRAREMATRRLFGASRLNVFSKMVMESTMMVFISFAIGIVLAIAFAPTFGNAVDRKLDMTVMLRPMVVIAMIALIAIMGIIAGIVPAAITSRVKPIEIIKGMFTRQTKMVLSKVFIVIQNVITIAMLASAAIMLVQTWHLVHAPLGFNTDNVLRISVTGQTDDSEMRHFVDDLRREPFVSKVAASWGTPLDGGNNNTLVKNGKQLSFQFIIAEPAMMDIYGLRLKDGAQWRDKHYYANKEAVGDITQVLSLKMQDFPRRVPLYGVDSLSAFGGVFEDFQVGNIQREKHPMLIFVQKEVTNPWYVSAKIEGNAADAYNKIADLFKADFHTEMTSDDAEFADKTVQNEFDEEVRTSRLVAMFAAIAIVISLLGLIAMSTYFIQQRRKEIAIRKVFGSTPGEVGRRLIRSFLSYVLIAFAIAVPLVAYVMGSWISQYSYRLSHWWLWIPTAGLFVLIVSYAAVAVQSHHASRQNPAVNLKSE